MTRRLTPPPSVCRRATLLAISAYLDTFQKIADTASSAKGEFTAAGAPGVTRGTRWVVGSTARRV